MRQKWVAGCLCGQNMKNYEWISCKKLWTWGGVNKFYITKLIFSKQSWKKIEKNWKKMHQKRVAGCLWHDLNMPRTCPGHLRICPGHGKTHEDSCGFLKIQNRTKTQQDTDIFVLQIAEQTFQICSHFPTKAASKIEPLCSQDMTRTWQDTCGVIGVFEKSEFDRNTGVFALKPVTPQLSFKSVVIFTEFKTRAAKMTKLLKEMRNP